MDDPIRAPRARMPLADRLWPKVDVRGPDECWPWTGSITTRGYGAIRMGGARDPRVGAHRAVYLLTHGEIPEGLVVDHQCNNTVCCNPAHLKAMTQAENVRRAYA